MWGRAGRPRLPGMKPWLLAAFVALNVSTASAACQPGPAVLDQAAGRLDEALQTLAHRTGCPVTVDPELLRGRQAPAVQGVFTPPQALVATLRGSGLEGRPGDQGLTVDRRDQDAVLGRAARLMDRLEQAVAGRRLSQARANRWRSALHGVSRGVQHDARRQGFVSAAELASYRRALGEVEQGLDEQDLAAGRAGR